MQPYSTSIHLIAEIQATALTLDDPVFWEGINSFASDVLFKHKSPLVIYWNAACGHEPRPDVTVKLFMRHVISEILKSPRIGM